MRFVLLIAAGALVSGCTTTGSKPGGRHAALGGRIAVWCSTPTRDARLWRLAGGAGAGSRAAQGQSCRTV